MASYRGELSLLQGHNFAPPLPSANVMYKDILHAPETNDLLPNVDNKREATAYKQRKYDDPKGYRKAISEVTRDMKKPRKEAVSIAVFGTRLTFHGEMLDRFFATYRKIFCGKTAHLPGNKKRRASKFRDLREDVDLDVLVFRDDRTSEQVMNSFFMEEDPLPQVSHSINAEVENLEIGMPDALKNINDFSIDLEIAREDTRMGKLMRCILRLEKYIVQRVPCIVLKDGSNMDKEFDTEVKSRILDAILVCQRLIMWARATALLSAVPKEVIHGASRILSEDEGAPPPRKKHMTKIETTHHPAWSDRDEREEPDVLRDEPDVY